MGRRRLPAWWPWPVAAALSLVLGWMLLGGGGGAPGGGEGADRGRAAPPRRWPAAAYPAARPSVELAALRIRVRRAIARLVEEQGDRIGVYVGGTAPGEDLLVHHADGPFVPASNAKLFATGAAWLALGPDAVLTTRCLASGAVEGGVLRGDLVVVGGGDPGLSPRVTKGDPADPTPAFARAVADAGITRITGEILLDDGLFDDVRTHPDWDRDERLRAFEAPVTALLLNDACVHVLARPGPEVGAPAAVGWEPRCDAVSVASRVTTKARWDRSAKLGALRAPGTEAFTLVGGVEAGTGGESGDFAVDDPTLVFGSVLLRSLRAAGIDVEGRPRRSPGAGARPGLRELARAGTPLSRNVLEANAESSNLSACCLLKLVGARMEGEGSWPAGARAIEGALREEGIPAEGLSLVDGSGLAESNRCTPRQVAAWLRYLLATPRGEAFRGTLAQGGEGTLENRLRDAGVRGRVRLKTGYIVVEREGGARGYRARALSGYVDAGAAGTLVVSLLSRDVPSDVLDRIVRALVLD